MRPRKFMVPAHQSLGGGAETTDARQPWAKDAQIGVKRFDNLATRARHGEGAPPLLSLSLSRTLATHAPPTPLAIKLASQTSAKALGEMTAGGVWAPVMRTTGVCRKRVTVASL